MSKRRRDPKSKPSAARDFDELNTLTTPQELDDRSFAAESRQLLVCHPAGTRFVPLRADKPLVLGRSRPADIVIPEPSISRAHVRITTTESAVRVRDLGSTNGTWSAGKRVEEVELTTGSEVALGGDVVLRLIAGSTPHEGLTGRDEFGVLLKQEVLRARQSGDSVAVVMMSPGPEFGRPVTTLAGKIASFLRPLDHLSCYSSSVLQAMLVGRDHVGYSALGERLVDALSEHKLRIGIASLHDSPTSALGLLELALRRMRAATQAAPLVSAGHRDSINRDEGMIAASPSMRALMDTVEQVAPVRLPILLIGETGSGKEVVASAIHQRGPRQQGPFKTLNCGAIPSQLAESLLFGHRKGAFTGAVEDRAGIFEQAHGGTVFLDEIGELAPEIQAKLLRVLETKRVTRVGSHDEIEFDSRVVAATHRDLSAMCATGEFREDLFFRLNGMSIHIPPLRERIDDIQPLAERFESNAARDNGMDSRPLSPEALRCLQSYSWPGNVRELRNVMERAVVVARGANIQPHDFPPMVAGATGALIAGDQDPVSSHRRSQPTHETLDEEVAKTPPPQMRSKEPSMDQQIAAFEADLLLAALSSAGGNKSRAAALLQMPRRSFINKLEEHEVLALVDAGKTPSESSLKLIELTSFRDAVTDFSVDLIRRALAACDGQKATAARHLGVPVHVIKYKIKKYQIE